MLQDASVTFCSPLPIIVPSPWGLESHLCVVKSRPKSGRICTAIRYIRHSERQLPLLGGVQRKAMSPKLWAAVLALQRTVEG